MMARKMIWIIFGLILALFVVSIIASLAAIAVPNFIEAQKHSQIRVTHAAQPENLALNEALIEAARTGQQGKVAEMVRAGANINFRDASGKTALHYAAAGGHNGTTGDLLRLGADPFIRDQAGRTALDYAQAGGHEATASEFVKAIVAVKPSRTPAIVRVLALVPLVFLALFLMVPILILLVLVRHLIRRRVDLNLSRDEEAQFQQLGVMAQKLEDRMSNLETILTDRDRAPERDLGVEP
jgi:phage shock protein B